MDRHTLPSISYETAEQCGRNKGGKAGGSTGGSRPAGGSGDPLGLRGRGNNPRTSELSARDAEIASRALARRISAQGQRNSFIARNTAISRGSQTIRPDFNFGRV